MGDEKHALDECLQFESERISLVKRVVALGVRMEAHSLSIFQLLEELDRYAAKTRLQVWKAAALFMAQIIKSHTK